MALFSLIARLGLDGTSFETGVLRAQSVGQKFAKTLKGEVGSAIATVFAVDKFVQYGAKAIELGGKLTDLSSRIGVSAEFLQEQAYAAELAGGSLDDVSSALEKLSIARTKALGGDSGTMDAFARFGITAQEIKSAKLEDIFLKIGKAFEGSSNPQALIGAFREFAGKGAGSLIPAMADGLGEAAQKAHELGLVLSNEVVASLDDAGDRLTVMNQTITNGMGSLMGNVLQPVLGWLEAVGSALQTVKSMTSIPMLMSQNPFEQLSNAGKQAYQSYRSSLDDQQSAAMAVKADRERKAKERLNYNMEGETFGAASDKQKGGAKFSLGSNSDPLARIGGFTGFGSTSDPVVRELQKQVRSLERIVKASEDTARAVND